MYKKQEVLEFLNNKNIEFEMVEHEAVFTIEEMNNLNLEEKGVGVKNLFLRDEKGKNHFIIVAKDETKKEENNEIT